MCALFLAGAALAAWFVPVVAETKLAWTSAAPCAAESAAHDRDCLTTLSSVIARTEVERGKGNSYLYFAAWTADRPAGGVEGGARGFEAGDRVRLTVWRGQVREVVGEEHAWREHFPASGEVTVVAALCVLAAGDDGRRDRAAPSRTPPPRRRGHAVVGPVRRRRRRHGRVGTAVLLPAPDPDP